MTRVVPPTSKKRNPQDATLRNVRALKTRVSALEKELRKIDKNTRVLLNVHNRLSLLVGRFLKQHRGK